MENQKVKTILKSVVIIAILFVLVFALRAQSADINGVPNQLKANYMDADGLPYFSEMDSYFNLRMTQDYMDHGYFGDTLVNGSGWDMHSYYPSGREVGSYQPMIAYVTSALYGIINIFQDMSIVEVAFWTGAFISSFAVIPVYIFTRRITNDYGAIAATLIVALGPNYISHTFAGFFDTDMFNIILPLFFILFFVEAVKSDKFAHRIIFSILSVLSIGLYSLSWTGFMFYPAVMILVMIVFFVLCFYLNIEVVEPFKNYSNKLKWLINQKELFSVIFIIILAIIGLLITVGIDGILAAISGLTGGFSLQSAANDVWPNVYISVAEMQIPNLLSGGLPGAFLANTNGIVNGIGGIVALFGVLFVLFTFVQRLLRLKSVKIKGDSSKPHKSKRKATSLRKEQDRFRITLKDIGSFGSSDEINRSKRLNVLYLSLFLVWILASAAAVTQGTRFIQVLVVPMGICAGIFVGYAADYVKANIESDRILLLIAFVCSFLIAFPITQIVYGLENALMIGSIVFVVLLAISGILIYVKKSIRDSDVSIKKTLVVLLITLALISPTVCGAYQTTASTVPGSSDPMWNAMDFVKENSTNDTVIISWWDFGYLFQIASDRPTAFDGGSQSGDRAFWVGKALTTSDLAQSKGILQMLGTTGSNASDLLCDYTGSNVTAVEALDKTLGMSKANAKSTLIKDYNLTEKQASAVVKQSHPSNPNNISFVLSSDMIQKAGWWSYFGSWNFDTLNSTNYQYYMASNYVKIKPNSQGSINVLNDSGIEYNAIIKRGANGTNETTAQMTAVWSNNGSKVDVNGTEYNPLKASNLIAIENNYLTVNKTLDKKANYTLYLIGSENEYTAILMDNELKDSVFTRLFLLGGMGQDTFVLSNMQEGVSVWTINDAASSSDNSDTNTTDT
ncbi:STT3 domain-containing protein [Methanobrevibacter olleyae]|uniref:dolichyl-phosphooligosaccharide-protein glycotransferase n=1 Tax=Methanobrevibacter olleyae TaxID=294671 RepID=A0A126QWT5_METOL|nr:STT3 domain-containing protein [Methanobrevibacter olleyae]AMK14623.1 oligosaccharyl transferase [Methanobrevibacter olleyae]